MLSRRNYPHRRAGSGDAVAKYLGNQQAAVMAIVWERGSATVREALEQMGGKVAYTTVMTMMVRLYERGLLERRPDGRGYRYRATKTREEFVSQLAGALLQRLVDDFGDAALAQILGRADELDVTRAAQLRTHLADG